MRQSLVLLKNNGGLLPLAADKHVLVTGDGADNISKQNGGWTITWQGTGLNNADFPGGNVGVGRREGRGEEPAAASAELSTDGSFKKKPDYAIVVFGENPYAEFQGDLKVLTLPGSMTQHLDIMKKLSDEKIPVVAILLSGRPLWQNRELNLANAYVAAWLPGHRRRRHLRRAVPQERWLGEPRLHRQAVVSRGRVTPRATPLNVNKEPYDPLFPFGFGLTYAASGGTCGAAGRSGHSRGAHVDGFVSSTRACPCSPGRCAFPTAPTPRASPPCRLKRSVAASRSRPWMTPCRKAARRFVFDGSGSAAVADHERRRGRHVTRSERRRHVVGAPASRRGCPERREARHGLRRRLRRLAAVRRHARRRSPPASGRPSACRSSASRRPAST